MKQNNSCEGPYCFGNGPINCPIDCPLCGIKGDPARCETLSSNAYSVWVKMMGYLDLADIQEIADTEQWEAPRE